MKTTVKVQGLKELDKALGEFTKATARNIALRALMAAGEPMAEAAREKAPERFGDLKRSIKVTKKKPIGHASKAAFAEVMKAGGTRAQAGAAQRAYNRENPGAFAEVFVGPAQLAQAWPQEIGTVNHPPHPYMRPAFEETKEEALSILVSEMGAEISRAAERARRKALRKKG